MNEITMNEYPPDDLQAPALAYRLMDGAAWITSFVRAIDSMNRRHKARRQSAVLDARVLKDLGISEAQRFIETNKSFWEQ